MTGSAARGDPRGAAVADPVTTTGSGSPVVRGLPVEAFAGYRRCVVLPVLGLWYTASVVLIATPSGTADSPSGVGMGSCSCSYAVSRS